jgi:hypothetical protein
MATTYGFDGRRRATLRTWLALGGAVVAVVLLLVMIAVVWSGASGREPAALESTPSPPAPTDAGDAGPVGDGAGDPADAPGGGAGPGEDGAADGAGPEPVGPASEDCRDFDPANVTIHVNSGDWVLRTGEVNFTAFASAQEADQAAMVARHSTRACFIGRGNDRDDRYRYLVHYFEGVSNLPAMPMPQHDCLSYDPPNLNISFHAGDWWLLDGPGELLPLASQADAERAKLVAGQHTRLCYIGRGNDRSDHDRFTMSYWLG